MLARAQSLATTSLNATITFLTQMMGFIDTNYDKLRLYSKFSAADQASSLTTRILDRFCEDLYAPKEGVAAAMTVEDPTSLENEAQARNLADSEVYMFRDNATVESLSPKLLNLVICLHGLMTRSGVKIHIKGTDAVLRGYLGQGLMAGESMVAHIPVHASAVDRSPLDLVPWIRSWSGKETILLELEGWFEAGNDIEGWRQDEDGFETRPILSYVLKIYIWPLLHLLRRWQ